MASAVLARSALPPAPDPVPKLLRDLIHERTGVFFEPNRIDIMLEKLEPRLQAYRCPTYLEYYYILKYEEKGPAEWRRVMDAFSVQETYFWRETDQIQAVAQEIAPRWFRDHSTPLRIWSAACATGEEPYSIAIALAEAGLGQMPIEIVASDASETALQKARAGLFRDRSFRSLPVALQEKYFRESPEGMRLDPDICRRIDFRWANLVSPASFGEFGDFPVIFCRNVFIYFSSAAIQRVIGSFATRMPVGGHLFVGASESLLKLTNQYELNEIRGAFAYVRNDVR